jgi:hypothetical protein
MTVASAAKDLAQPGSLVELGKSVTAQYVNWVGLTLVTLEGSFASPRRAADRGVETGIEGAGGSKVAATKRALFCPTLKNAFSAFWNIQIGLYWKAKKRPSGVLP